MFLQLEEASKKRGACRHSDRQGEQPHFRHACNLKSLKTLQRMRKYTETTQTVKILIGRLIGGVKNMSFRRFSVRASELIQDDGCRVGGRGCQKET